MTFQNYFYTSRENPDDTKSYEEQLLLNYDDYLEGTFANERATHPLYSLEIGNLEDDHLEDGI